jgi:DNA-binding GntR family transcriptional regulator
MKLDAKTEESLARRAYRTVRHQILEGELEPGQRLSLRRIAGSLGMSLAPVGEALRELARDGLLESEPGWGTRVRRMDREALRNQHVLRIAIECEAARECSLQASESQFAELLELAEELDRRIDSKADPSQIRDLDSQFHLRVAELSGATALVEVLKANQLVRMLARGSLLAHNRTKPLKQHVRLAKALASRNPDQAEQSMREHCERSMRLQLEDASRTSNI